MFASSRQWWLHSIPKWLGRFTADRRSPETQVNPVMFQSWFCPEFQHTQRAALLFKWRLLRLCRCLVQTWDVVLDMHLQIHLFSCSCIITFVYCFIYIFIYRYIYLFFKMIGIMSKCGCVLFSCHCHLPHHGFCLARVILFYSRQDNELCWIVWYFFLG